MHFYITIICIQIKIFIQFIQAWIDAEPSNGLNVFTIGKRSGKFASWEPIYIGTALEPLYDERLSWEGKRDKMVQVCCAQAFIIFFF